MERADHRDGRRQQPHHFLVLDSLRGICAILVAIFHFHSDGLIGRNLLVQNAQLLVDFFFVLSGFVIAASYGARLRSGYSLTNFVLLRLGRLYPLHIVVLLAYFAFWLIEIVHRGTAGDQPLYGFFQTAALLQIFTSNPDGVGNWNRPSWSIAAELWTYVIFALLWRYAGRMLLPAIAAIILFAPLGMMAATDRNLDACFEGALFRSCYGFGIGVVGYDIWSRFLRHGAVLRSPALKTMVEAAMLALCAGAIIAAGTSPLSFACPPLFLAVILVFSGNPGWFGKMLAAGPFLRAGALSYSIYLIHMFIQARLLNLLDAASARVALPIARADFGVVSAPGYMLASDVAVLAMLACVVVCARFTHRHIEMPGRDWMRRLVDSRRSGVRVGA